MLIVLIALLSISIGYSIYLSIQNKKVVERNEEMEKYNEKVLCTIVKNEQANKTIERDIQEHENQLAGLKSSIDAQNNILKSLTSTEQEMRRGAEERAEEYYQSRVSALELQYQNKIRQYQEQAQSLEQAYINKNKEIENQLKQLNESIVKEQQALQDLKNKQSAYIEARKRERQMEEQKDFYRLAVTEADVADVQALRRIQPSFSRKDTIDKLIWENYYKPAYDLLMGRLGLITGKKVCGIYKITNLDTSEAYIGQSVDIRERMRQHIKSSLDHTPASNKLYQAMQSYGSNNFSFEVLEEVSRDKLNERETYWIDFFDTKTSGMNKTVGGS